MIEAYRQLADVTDHPAAPRRHRSRPAAAGLVKATAGIATLLAEGIGDTIRYSLTADPVEEAKAGPRAARGAGPARAQGPRPHRVPVAAGGPRSTSSPSPSAAQAALERHEHPAAGRGDGLRGERSGRGARRPTSASPPARERGHLFVKGEVVRVVPEAEMVDALVRAGPRST